MRFEELMELISKVNTLTYKNSVQYKLTRLNNTVYLDLVDLKIDHRYPLFANGVIKNIYRDFNTYLGMINSEVQRECVPNINPRSGKEEFSKEDLIKRGWTVELIKIYLPKKLSNYESELIINREKMINDLK